MHYIYFTYCQNVHALYKLLEYVYTCQTLSITTTISREAAERDESEFE